MKRFLITSLLFLVTVQINAEEKPNSHKGWVDYDDLDQTKRLKERPGNFKALTAIGQFFEDRAKSNPRKTNKLRQFNVYIRKISLHDAATFLKSPAANRLLKSQRKQFIEVRKRHPGRAVLALVDVDLKALQCPTVEQGTNWPIYLIWNKDRWQVAWYEY